jgi:hypothetical protein
MKANSTPISHNSIEDTSFWQYVWERINLLREEFPYRIYTSTELPDTPRNPSRRNILSQISDKLSKHYCTWVDALSWFIVLYHGNGTFHRQAYREIESLLWQMNCSHTGKDGSKKIYNNTSIWNLLRECGWESAEHTNHSSQWKESKALKKWQEMARKVQEIVDAIKKTLPWWTNLMDDLKLPSTESAALLMKKVAQHYPEIDSLWRRKKASVLKLLTWSTRFTSDSFR